MFHRCPRYCALDVFSRSRAAASAVLTVTRGALDAGQVGGMVTPRPVECTPVSRATFACGPTSVMCTAANSSALATTHSFTVTLTPFAAPAPARNTGLKTLVVCSDDGEAGAIECRSGESRNDEGLAVEPGDWRTQATGAFIDDRIRIGQHVTLTLDSAFT